MKQNPENGKYVLQNQLRTWTDLKRRAAAAQSSPTSTTTNPTVQRTQNISYTPSRRWGGCVNGCNHGKLNFPRRTRRQNTLDSMQTMQPQQQQNEEEDHPTAAKEEKKAIESGVNNADANGSPVMQGKKSRSSSKSPSDYGASVESADTNPAARTESLNPPATNNSSTSTTFNTTTVKDESASDVPAASPGPLKEQTPVTISPDDFTDTDVEPPTEPDEEPDPNPIPPQHLPNTLLFGGSRSGLASPTSGSDDESDYFDTNIHQLRTRLFVSAPQSSLRHAHAPPRSEASRAILSQIGGEEKSSGGGGGGGGSGTASPKSASSVGGGLRRSRSRKSLRERAGSKGRSKERTESRSSRSSRSGRNGSVASKTDRGWVTMSGKKADALGGVSAEGVGDGDELRGTPNVSVAEAVVEEMKARDRKGFGEVY